MTGSEWRVPRWCDQKLLVTVIGSSSFVPTRKRTWTSVLLDFGNEDRVLLDAGSARLLRPRQEILSVSHIYISHNHPDHTIFLGPLVRRMQRRKRRALLTIHCPTSAYPRVRFFIRLFNRFCIPLFVRFEVFVPGAPSEVNRFANSNTRVWAASECHVVDAAAYAFLQGDTKVVFATDTRANCASVIALAKGATAFFHDATFPTRAARMARVRGHSSPEGAGIDATRAGARTLVLTHVSDIRFPDERALVVGAQHHYKGRIIVAKDKQTYEF